MALQIDFDPFYMQPWCQACAADNRLEYLYILGRAAPCQEVDGKLRQKMTLSQGVFDDRISLFDTKVSGNDRTLGLQEIEYGHLLTGECFVVSLPFAND